MSDEATERRSDEGRGEQLSSSPSSVIPLSDESSGFSAPLDRRRHIPPPPPVVLVTVEDARLLSSIGWDRELDDFYVGLLRFERDHKSKGIVYKAENFRIIFDLVDGPVERDDMRMLGIIVKSLRDTAERFRAADIEFERVRGLIAGDEQLNLTDPAGNWLRITQSKPVM